MQFNRGKYPISIAVRCMCSRVSVESLFSVSVRFVAKENNCAMKRRSAELIIM
jgi:hypothetical protein